MMNNAANGPRARAGRWATTILMACLLPAGPVAAQEAPAARPQDERISHMLRILEGLERGMESLAALERHDAMELLGDIADGVRREIEQARQERPRRRADRERPLRRGPVNEERRIIEEQTEVLRLAMRALLEAERHDAAHRVERAIHARELMLEGRNDPEAREIRQSAPNRRETLELLVLAERLYREFDLEEMADRVSAMTEKLWDERTGRENVRAREGEGERERRRAVERERRERDRLARAERNEQRRAERGRRSPERADQVLRDRLDRLQEHLADLQREMEALRRELDRRER